VLTAVLAHDLAADPALPHRDRLLDAAAVAARLTPLLGLADIRTCTLVRAKYRITDSLRVVYRLHAGDRQHLLAARAFTDGGGAAAYRRAAATAVPVDGLPGVVLDQALDTVWWTFPNDRRLRGLAELMHPADRLYPSWQHSEVVEYAPERSVALRAVDHTGVTSAFAKVFAPGSVDVAALADRYRRIATALAGADQPVGSPRPLSWWMERDLLLLEAMPGVRWSELPVNELPDAVGRLGAAIATLHAAGPTDRAAGLRRFTRLALPRVLHSAELVGRARPDVAVRARQLAIRLADTMPAAEGPVLLHGDCHPKNALITADRIGLIDLDQAGTGAAANDIGSLLARLHQDELLGGPAAADLGAAFLDGYAGVRPPPSGASVRWHTAAALLAERAMRAVNRVHAPVLGHLDELLAAADRTLREGVRR